MTIFWFRRDLRLEDNTGLFYALKNGEDVLPIFIFDDIIISQLPQDDARVSFIHWQLQRMQNQLRAVGKSLAIFHGSPLEIFTRLVAENSIKKVFTNHDYEPYARKRDLEIYHLLQKHDIEFITSKDQVIFEKSEVVKDDGTPYVVFTPYSNKWINNFSKISVVNYNSEDYLNKISLHPYSFLQLEDMNLKRSLITVPPYDISDSLIDNYEATRNFPALDKTSYLGAYLRFGVV